MSRINISRRHFLKTSAVLSGLAAVNVAVPAFCTDAAPSNKLNVAVIGPCNRGGANLSGVIGENVLAICDVDSRNLAAAGERVPNARKFEDFRKMLEAVERDIDAVVVSTPDHTHAVCAALALRMGTHCYCEKPLTHEVFECRTLQKLAKEKNLVTQMGTQIHAEENYRQVVELIQTGAIGPVREVHTWFSPVGAINVGRPAEQPVPEYLNWDLWLGPAAYRPYSPVYHPGTWRRYWDFGNGTMGDFACHHMDLPFWALNLSDCTTVDAVGENHDPEGTPHDLEVVYTFPARGDLPPVTLTWYNGHMPAVLDKLGVSEPPIAGNLFVGEKGMIVADYSMHRLLPEEKFADFRRPDPFIPRSSGFHAEWIQACKDNRPDAPTCQFGYSGRLTETVLLGSVSFKMRQKLVWDAENLRITNVEAANALLSREYRPGWEL